MAQSESADGEQQKSYFDGGVLGFIGWVFLCFFITVCTLGLAFPWAICLFNNWKFSHTVIEGRRLKFTGAGINLFGKYILWWFLCIITFGIYGFWLFIAMEKWMVKNTTFAD